MKTLIVDDEFTSRLLIQQILQEFGEIHIAVNGHEAVEAVTLAIDNGAPYDLIYLDIVMPVMNGGEALKQIRQLESAAGLIPPHSARIIIGTGLSDGKTIMAAFREQCDAYLVKPIERAKLLKYLHDFNLID